MYKTAEFLSHCKLLDNFTPFEEELFSWVKILPLFQFKKWIILLSFEKTLIENQRLMKNWPEIYRKTSFSKWIYFWNKTIFLLWQIKPKQTPKFSETFWSIDLFSVNCRVFRSLSASIVFVAIRCNCNYYFIIIIEIVNFRML